MATTTPVLSTSPLLTTSPSSSTNVFINKNNGNNDNYHYEYIDDNNNNQNILSTISTTSFQASQEHIISIFSTTSRTITTSLATFTLSSLDSNINKLPQTTSSITSLPPASTNIITTENAHSSIDKFTSSFAPLTTTAISATLSFPSTNIMFDGVNIGETVIFNNSSQGDVINTRVIQATFCCLYTAIFVLGIFGNVLVCYVVFRNKAMQTVTNLFITNLALSDILLCTLAVPFTPLYTFLGRWIFGTVLCRLVPYAQGCSVYISTLTLTSIAIDRFFVIIYPFHPRMRLSTCIFIILGIWIFSLLVTLPYGLYMEVVHLNFTGVYTHYCEENWPSEYYRKIFGSMTSVLQYALPFFVISFCYICVSIRLNERAKTKPGTKTTKKEEIERDRKRRTNLMLIAMVGVFGISWLPLNVTNVLNDFHASIDEWNYYNLLFFISHCIAMSSTCYNPFLYAWLNDNFRKEFKLVMPCFRKAHHNKRNKCLLPDSQRWIPEPTFNGNNETVQESLITSSFIKSSFNSFGNGGGSRYNSEPRESMELDEHQNSTIYIEHSIGSILPEVNGVSSSKLSNQLHPVVTSTTHVSDHIQSLQTHVNKNYTTETVQIVSGVLETEFKDSLLDQQNQQQRSIAIKPITRIRVEADGRTIDMSTLNV